MGLFPLMHSERIAPGSFQQPVPIPTPLPGASPLVQVCFNKDWLPYILGCLTQLTLNTTWQAANQTELNQIFGEANNLILIFQQALASCQTQNPGFAGAGDDFMLRQSPDNPCLLQTSVDGVTWCTWADLSKCTGQAQQPAQGTPTTPSGGCIKYFGTVEFGSRWMLPNNVNTGDVVTVTNAIGTWASALDLFLARCPDGNLWFELACVEGTGHTEPGDPAPTINHDSLIAYDGTHFYDCGPASDGMPVVITIGPGVANANLFFFANTPDTSGFGAVNFDVEYCNNKPATWCRVYDFTANSFGVPGNIGVCSTLLGTWVAGSGLTTVDHDDGAGNFRRELCMALGITPGVEITSVDLQFSYTPGTFAGSPDSAQQILVNSTSLVDNLSGSTVNGSHVHLVAHPDIVGSTEVTFQFTTSHQNSAVYDGSCFLEQLTIQGKGPAPTTGNPCSM